jgi:hypothetical protein
MLTAAINFFLGFPKWQLRKSALCYGDNCKNQDYTGIREPCSIDIQNFYPRMFESQKTNFDGIIVKKTPVLIIKLESIFWIKNQKTVLI